MTDRAIEDDLREAFAARVAAPPHTPGLAETVLRQGRRVRGRRRAATAALAVVALAGAVTVATSFDRPVGPPAAALDGPPRVPLHAAQEPATLTTWPDGQRRERPLDAAPVAVLADGTVLVVLPGERPGLALLGVDGSLRPVAAGLADSRVAVGPFGDRVAVVSGAGGRRTLEERSLPSGDVLRAVPLAAPLVGDVEPVLPVAYTDLGVLLTLGEGQRQRAAVWERGDSAVVGTLDGYAQALGGSGAHGAFRTTDDDRCRVEVAALTTGGGSWRLCREPFAGFSPDGRYVLATSATGDALVVRDAVDGSLVREVEVPAFARAYGWESSRTTLHTTVAGDRTVVVRCDVVRGRCRTAATFRRLDRIPQPVPPAGP